MSSDSDVPLAQLARGKVLRPPQDDDEEDESGSSSEEAEFDDGDESDSDDDDDDDEDFADKDESDDDDDDDSDDGSDSDSDDDVPLSRLKSPGKKKKAAAAKPAAKKKAAAEKKSPAKKKPPAKKKVSAKKKVDTKAKKAAKKFATSGNSKPKKSSSGPTLASAELYASCIKGRLIMQILCRWWYAVTWPEPKTLPGPPSAKYDALDGFPGVYVCTGGEEVGKIADTRDMTTAPTFRNFARKSSKELVGLLTKAIAAQREQLVEAEGAGTDTEKALKEMDKWAKKLDCAKADREAERVLKAAKVRL